MIRNDSRHFFAEGKRIPNFSRKGIFGMPVDERDHRISVFIEVGTSIVC